MDTGSKSPRRRWYADPLFLFLALGGGLFALYAVVAPPEAPESGIRIEVTAADVARIRGLWEKQWRRPPTDEELAGLVEDHIREEVLSREARSLGLDQDDTIIRRRLVQKMEFVTEDLARQAPPTDEELRRFYEQNLERYQEPALVTFRHLYFDVDKRDDAEADARALLSELRRRPEDPALWRRADRFLLPGVYVENSERQIALAFGDAFAEAVIRLPPGEWSGPVRSGFGVHLVRVDERREPRQPDLSEVRERVLVDLQDDRNRRANEEIYRKLRERYEIVIDPDALTAQAAPSPGGAP